MRTLRWQSRAALYGAPLLVLALAGAVSWWAFNREKRDIDIGRDHLAAGGTGTAGAANERAGARQHVVDRSTALGGTRLDSDPVAGDGIGTVLGLVGELTGERRSQFTSICDDLVETALLDDDARRDAALRGIGGKFLLKRFAPAELFDQGGFP